MAKGRVLTDGQPLHRVGLDVVRLEDDIAVRRVGPVRYEGDRVAVGRDPRLPDPVEPGVLALAEPPALELLRAAPVGMDPREHRVVHRVAGRGVAASREVPGVVDALDVVDPLAVGRPARHRARAAGGDLDRLVASLRPEVALLDEDERPGDVRPRIDDDDVRRRRRALGTERGPTASSSATAPTATAGRAGPRQRDRPGEQGDGDEGDGDQPDHRDRRSDERARGADPVGIRRRASPSAAGTACSTRHRATPVRSGSRPSSSGASSATWPAGATSRISSWIDS